MLESQIPDPEILVGIAALGLTVTGFSGLISVLGRRAAGKWTDAERFQLGELIAVSLTVTFAAFIPILVSMVQAGPNSVAISSFLVALVHLFVLLRGSLRNFRDGRNGAKIPNATAAIMIFGGAILIAATFLSAFQIIGGAAFFIVANLLWQLFVASVHFVILLMGTSRLDED